MKVKAQTKKKFLEKCEACKYSSYLSIGLTSTQEWIDTHCMCRKMEMWSHDVWKLLVRDTGKVCPWFEEKK